MISSNQLFGTVALCFVLCIAWPCTSLAQLDKADEKNTVIEQRVELIAENLESEEIDLTTLFDALSYLFDHPINLNQATAQDLGQLYLLDDIQINNLLDHIARTGKLLTIYELQSVKGFDVTTIRLIQPFVKVSDQLENNKLRLDEVLSEGGHELFMRYIRILEEQAGFSSIEDSLLEENPNRRFLGSPDRLYSRYRFKYSNRISVGITAEKDAGEEFFQGTQKRGFDFYSAHIYLHNVGKVKHLAIGDYQAEFGQGLTFWSGLAFGKSADILGIKRNARGFKPYTSVEENRFLRGAATTIALGKFEVSGFYSSKDIDANISEADTVDDNREVVVVSSFQNSGFHRTPNELEDRDAIKETIYGTHLAYVTRRLSVGFTAVQTDFGAILNRNLQLYNQYEFNSNQNQNLGLDYNLVLRNFNFFGEVARSKSGGLAYTNGLLISVDPKVDFVVLNRNFQRDYQALNGNAVSESTRDANEKGTYVGIVARPIKRVSISAYYDRFQFPWMRFLVNAPSSGLDYLTQINYVPSKKLSMYLRYRQEVKGRNSREDATDLITVEDESRQYFRYHIAYKIAEQFELKSRVEFSRYQLGSDPEENGFVIYQDFNYRKKGFPVSFSTRYALFDTDSYNARIYAYENDVLYFFSIPALSDRGSRVYIVSHYRVRRGIDVWLKYARTAFANRDNIGSGLNLIDGNTRSEIRLQVRFKI